VSNSEQHSKQQLEVARLILEELKHFVSNYKVPNRTDHSSYLSSQHLDAVTASRAAAAALTREPFIGYAYARRDGKRTMRLLICRHYTPIGVSPADADTMYASYLSPMGQIVATRVGEKHGYWELLEKSRFRPECGNKRKVDAIECLIDTGGASTRVPSVLEFLESKEVKKPSRKRPTERRKKTTKKKSVTRNATKPIGRPQRELRYTVQLPAQAVLDEVQDEIFRLPIQESIRISGAPGTGKTTVLIKRLSQKTKPEFWTEQEKRRLSILADEEISWIFFSPCDLLKSYLKEALGKELLPATDDHVKVYRTFRQEVLRDIGIIRVGKKGHFRMSNAGRVGLLKTDKADTLIKLSKRFSKALRLRWSDIAAKAIHEFAEGAITPIELFPSQSNGEIARIIDSVLANVKDVLQEKSFQHDSLRSVIGTGERYSLLGSKLKRSMNEAKRIGKHQDTIAIVSIISRLQGLTQKVVRNLSLIEMFRTIPGTFEQFRSEQDVAREFYRTSAAKEMRKPAISEPEMDILLLECLRFIHALPKLSTGNTAGATSDIQSLASRFKVLVMVDEAADFSPLELACMELFARPDCGGVTISGDLMQRVTDHGLRSWDEMSAVCRPYKGKELETGYRQTAKLFNIATALSSQSTGERANFRSAYELREEDPPALLLKSSGSKPVGPWLTERICEIFEISNRHLPTTAILVPTSEDVEVISEEIGDLLQENGLELESSSSGQALGDTARIRVFSVEYIKGLEFEAVFYVGLDKMAEVHQELLEKYVYVGLSRARSFLGVTYQKRFPDRLKCIKQYFDQGGTWSQEHSE
jgi:hypothetical protein